MATAEPGAAVASHRVDLVHENDRWRVGLGLLEQVPYPACADTHKHLDEVRAGDRVEGHPGLTRDRSGQQGFACSRRPVQQHTFGDLGSHGLELARVLQELLYLLEFLDRLVGTRDISEGRFRRVLADELGLGLAEVHDPVAAALHLVHEEEQQENNEQYREQVQQQRQEDVALFDLDLVGDPLAVQFAGEPDRLVGDVGRLVLRAVLCLDLNALFGVLDCGAGNLARFDLLLDVVQVTLGVLA